MGKRNKRNTRKQRNDQNGFVQQSANQQVQLHKPLPPTQVPRPVTGLKSTANIAQFVLCDLYAIVTNGGTWSAYATANGFTTLGVAVPVSNQVPAAFDKYCQIYSQYTVMQIDILYCPNQTSSVSNPTFAGQITASIPPVFSSIQQDGTVPGSLAGLFTNNTGMMTPGNVCHNRTLDVQKLLQLNQSQPLIPTNGSAAGRALFNSPALVLLQSFSAVPGNNTTGYIQVRTLVRFEEQF